MSSDNKESTSSGLFAVMLYLQPVCKESIKEKEAAGQFASPSHQSKNYQAYAAFLDLLRQVDPALSQKLHDLNGRKPFTLSNLLENERPLNRPVRAGQTYSLRLTCLDETIFTAFINRFLGLDQSSLTLRLGETNFRIVRIGATQGEWTGRASFEGLGLESLLTSWQFEFASPTAFSLGEQVWGGRKFVVFPEPRLVFDSLANAWKEFAPPSLPRIEPAEMVDYVDTYLAVTHHNIQTVTLPFKGHQQIGFVGQVNFKLMERSPSSEWLTWLNRLAALAFYAGVGYKTTMGFGQTRLRLAPTGEKQLNTDFKELVRL